MNADIAFLILQDGIASGAIYAMMALGIVLVFNGTRVAFVPFGDLVGCSALTLGYLQTGQLPGTAWIVAILAMTAFLVEGAALVRRRQARRLGRAALAWLVVPLLPVAAAFALSGARLPLWGAVGLTFALVLPIGPLLYRTVFQPIANAPELVLLMVAVALHFVVSGLALLCFGPEGLRTTPFLRGDIEVAGQFVSQQTLLLVAAAALISMGLYAFFSRSIAGKALRATAMHREGARLVGIRTARAGAVTFLVASLIAAAAGVLISPTTTIYYDSGLMIGLKGFVGATVGGFVAYPAAMAGAVLVGLIESFSSFYASSFKEVIVFASIVPIVLGRWLVAKSHGHDDDEAEE